MNARLMLKIRSMLPILLLFSFSLPPLAFSADLTVVQRSGQVRHSLIVCSEGDVRSTGKKPSFPKKWRSLALQQAEASALSKARAFLEEKKRNHDNFDYKLSGSVRILNKKEAAPGEPGIRRMWIEAEVPYTPLIPQKKEPRQQESDRQVSEGTLNIQLWSDPGPFKNGKAATIYFQGSKDFYGRIVRIGSRNEVEQLLPNVYRQSSLFKKGGDLSHSG